MGAGPIAFIDSGMGGLPYLAGVRELLPAARLVYAADRRHFPYGIRTPAEITSAVLALTRSLVEREHPRMIVVACNTASVVALAELRRRFPLPFVGTVPAIKPAAAHSSNRRIGVLATSRTVEAAYLSDLVQRFARDCTIIGLPADDLVSFVEYRLFDATREERDAHLAEVAARVHAAGVDTLVLGCTHFLHLQAGFRAALGPDVAIVDSNAGVAKQVARLAGAGDSTVTPDLLYLTGTEPFEERHRAFARAFGLQPAGSL